MHPAQHIPQAIQSLAPIVDRYGYLAVGGLIILEDFGIPVPGGAVLIASAFFAGANGHLNIFLIALVGFIGAVIGNNIGFAIGNYGGHPLIERFGKYIFLTSERIAKVEAIFNRYGGGVVIVAQFIEGLRQANGVIAGLSEMRWPKYITFNAIGIALWVLFWVTVGYFGGSHIEVFLRYDLYFTLLIIGLLLGYCIYRLARVRRTQHSPRHY
jgi:membrane protein DedA with SNARE-associated domain